MIKKYGDFLINTVWIYLNMVMPPFLIVYAVTVFIPQSNLFFELGKAIPEFTTLIGMAVLFPAVGIYIAYKNNRFNFLLPWKVGRSKQVANFCISFFLAYFFWRFFYLLSFLGYTGLIVLFLIFVFYIPQMAVFISLINYDQLKTFFIGGKNKVISLLIGLLLINGFVFVVDRQVRAVNREILYQSKQPHIKLIKPKIAYYDTKVILLGSNFGWGGTIHTKFYNQYGPINISLWNDTKIIFTIPLHWKLGEINVWVETDIFWEGKKIHVKSNDVRMKLIDREGGFDEEDEEYFEQLKHLDEETLRINGYTK